MSKGKKHLGQTAPPPSDKAPDSVVTEIEGLLEKVIVEEASAKVWEKFENILSHLKPEALEPYAERVRQQRSLIDGLGKVSEAKIVEEEITSQSKELELLIETVSNLKISHRIVSSRFHVSPFSSRTTLVPAARTRKTNAGIARKPASAPKTFCTTRSRALCRPLTQRAFDITPRRVNSAFTNPAGPTQ